MTTVHPAMLPADQLLAACDVQRLRRGGPGGQHRNKVETTVVLLHRPTGIRAEANERRSQSENRRVALERLRVRLALEVRSSPQTMSGNSPSELWLARCRAGKITVSQTHDDYPALLAEAMDAVHQAEYDLALTAQQQAISLSQLLKFLKREPAAWQRVADARRQRRLPPLR